MTPLQARAVEQSLEPLTNNELIQVAGLLCHRIIVTSQTKRRLGCWRLGGITFAFGSVPWNHNIHDVYQTWFANTRMNESVPDDFETKIKQGKVGALLDSLTKTQSEFVIQYLQTRIQEWESMSLPSAHPTQESSSSEKLLESKKNDSKNPSSDPLEPS